jgi:hypothetical protein
VSCRRFLHQHQRALKHDAELGDYIETTLDDIAIANELAAELFGQSLDELSPPSRDLLRLIAAYVERRAAEEKQPAQEVEFSRRDLREALQWSEYQLRTQRAKAGALARLALLAGRRGACAARDPAATALAGAFQNDRRSKTLRAALALGRARRLHGPRRRRGLAGLVDGRAGGSSRRDRVERSFQTPTAKRTHFSRAADASGR